VRLLSYQAAAIPRFARGRLIAVSLASGLAALCRRHAGSFSMSNRFAHVCGVALLLAAPAGCTKKALQPDAGGTLPLPDSGGLDIGGSGDGGVTDSRPGDSRPVDVGLDLAFAGRRSYKVTSEVIPDDDTQVSPHTFVMTLDTSKGSAIFGSYGSGDTIPIEQDASGTLRFARAAAFGVFVPDVCGASLAYDDLSFTIDADGLLAGTGRGRLTIFEAGTQHVVNATAVLSGVPDTEAPILNLTSSGSLFDPWSSLWVVATEPLPGDQAPPVLRSQSGDVLAFIAGGDPIFTVVEKPRKMLRFDDVYQVTFDRITDYAGNPAHWAADTTFTTRGPPPVVPPDGFESWTNGTIEGAQILTGGGAPTISGASSLYVAPAPILSAPGFVTQFALRLALPRGKTMLRFTYRFVNPGDMSGIDYVIASVGGTIETVSLSWTAGTATTPATIGSDQVMLGPTTAATIMLPLDVHDDVVFARVASQSASCGGPPPPPVPGIIIDDLRIE